MTDCDCTPDLQKDPDPNPTAAPRFWINSYLRPGQLKVIARLSLFKSSFDEVGAATILDGRQPSTEQVRASAASMTSCGHDLLDDIGIHHDDWQH